MPSEITDLEMEFFIASRCRGIVHGFDMNPSVIRPERLQEFARRSTFDAPNILDVESLAVSAKKARELLQPVGMIRPFARIVLRTYEKMKIISNHVLDLTL